MRQNCLKRKRSGAELIYVAFEDNFLYNQKLKNHKKKIAEENTKKRGCQMLCFRYIKAWNPTDAPSIWPMTFSPSSVEVGLDTAAWACDGSSWISKMERETSLKGESNPQGKYFRLLLQLLVCLSILCINYIKTLAKIMLWFAIFVVYIPASSFFI